MSFHSLANSRILNDDGRTTQTDKSTSSESSQFGAAEPRASEDESKQPSRPKYTENISEKRQGKQPVQESYEFEMKGYLNKNYRDLLNSAIDTAAGASDPDSDALSTSHVGRSLWTSKEKEAFFHALSIRGRDDLPSISRAIGTKSEIEVRSYLLGLQTSCSESQSSSPAPSSADIPAAYDISERCENAISLTAEVLGRHVLQHDIELEKEKFGDLWLIDDELAARIEAEIQQKELASVIDLAGSDIEMADDKEAESLSEDEERPIVPDTSGIGHEKTEIMNDIPSADFLRAEAFLQLSRSLFMNRAVEPECNWSQVGPASGDFDSPAIFRSAFDNLHNIAINFTRWLVQATVFQTMSRLRAKDEQKPTVIVTTEDVKTALNFLNLSFDWRKYWSSAARRSGVDVYSDSKEYKDGRPGTKNGVLLTWDEVETELGYPRAKSSFDHANAVKQETPKSTETSGSDVSSSEDSDREELTDDDVDARPNSSESLEKAKKRKRADDILSYDTGDDEYLDHLDMQASRAEERRLMEMLRYSLSPSPQLEDAPEFEANVRCKRVKTDQQSNWRNHFNYMAEWEQRVASREEVRSEEGDGE